VGSLIAAYYILSIIIQEFLSEQNITYLIETYRNKSAVTDDQFNIASTLLLKRQVTFRQRVSALAAKIIVKRYKNQTK
jgi:hypothetical protein